MTHIHFIGIGGTGLSAIARVLHQRGVSVSGSDRRLSPLAAALRAEGVAVHVGHHASHVNGATLVVRSSAVPDENVEVQAARRKGVPVLKRADFLPQVLAGKTVIAIAGTHGKTTTTSMIAWMLAQLGLDPSFIVGALVAGLETNAHAGQGAHFVIEADEYDRMFLGLAPDIAVVTNVEHDHPDCFPTPEAFVGAFRDFTGQLTPDGTLIACADDPSASALLDQAAAAGRRVVAYGLAASCTLQARELQPQPGAGYRFHLYHRGVFQAALTLQVPGQHNVLNALAALAVGHTLGLPFAQSGAALQTFRGAARRFEVRGQAGGVTVIDDYAHHPTEIRATLSAARARYPDRTLWVVWQPHTYSRLQMLLNDFAAAFDQAHHLLITPVYAARETPPPGFSLQKLLSAMAHPRARFVPDLDAAARFLLDHLQPGDVLLTLSAGDADRISRDVLAALQSD